MELGDAAKRFTFPVTEARTEVSRQHSQLNFAQVLENSKMQVAPLLPRTNNQGLPRLSGHALLGATTSDNAALPVDKHPFLDAIGRHRAGRSQAALDAINLKTATNSDFVERINEDCHVGPHLEWIPAIAAAATKAIAKGYVAGKVGENAGYAGKATGIAAGATWGIVGGLYVGYETSELLENSCKSKAFEARLLQTGPNSGPVPAADVIPLPNLPNNVERQIPGVRDIVDTSKVWLRAKYYLTVNGTEPPAHNATVYERAMSQNSLGSADYIKWAKQESSYSPLGAATHHAVFSVPAYIGAAYTANKLGLVGGSLPLKLAGVAVGLGLSWLGMRAHEETTLSELYSARLLSKPNHRP